MTRLEMICEAMQALPKASAEELATLVEQRHGEKIEARFVPIFLASIRDKAHLAAKRHERATVAKE